MMHQDSTSLTFTGDIGFDKYMDGQWNDPELISQDVLSFLHSADHVIANVEGPLIGQEALAEAKAALDPGAAKLLHSMDPAAANVLDRMHADIWNLCNNHIMDAGPAGVQATLQEAGKHGAKTIGAGMNIEEASRPLVLHEAGGIGLFSCGYRRGCKPASEDHAGCLLWNDLDRIQANIDDLRHNAHCRWIVMVVHGGEEFTSLPSPYVRDRYLKFLDMGADIIVAHHPHVPMNYEIFPNDRNPEALPDSLGSAILPEVMADISGYSDNGKNAQSANQSSTIQPRVDSNIFEYSDNNIADTRQSRQKENSTCDTNLKADLNFQGKKEQKEKRCFCHGDKAIFYSLGNFIFDTDYQRAQFNTDKGVLVKLHFTENTWNFEAMGLQINRAVEHVESAPLPRIFTNVPEEEYEKLEPLSAAAFVAATKRQQIYLNPEEYKDADAAKWHENFWNPKRSGRVPGEALDFQIICPIADKAKEDAWKHSHLSEVVAYIQEQLK